ncbi:MAG: hypothetical protein ACRDPT_09950, partial [Streptomycetales bacterium]
RPRPAGRVRPRHRADPRPPLGGQPRIGDHGGVPVVVTAADSPLGRAVVDALLRAPGPAEVRATVRDRTAVPELLELGVRTAVGAWNDQAADALQLGGALEGAHTVVHLDGPESSWDLLLDAAQDTGVRRLVTAWPSGVEPPAAGGYELVVVRAAAHRPTPALVDALVAADRRERVRGLEIVDL